MFLPNGCRYTCTSLTSDKPLKKNWQSRQIYARNPTCWRHRILFISMSPFVLLKCLDWIYRCHPDAEQSDQLRRSSRWMWTVTTGLWRIFRDSDQHGTPLAPTKKLDGKWVKRLMLQFVCKCWRRKRNESDSGSIQRSDWTNGAAKYIDLRCFEVWNGLLLGNQ